MTRRIGLLGGSFNPAHDAHRELSLKALEWLALDQVWWLVTPGNPLKNQNIYAPYQKRLAQARKTADHPAIAISDFEQGRNLQYTIDTLYALKQDHPEDKFVWLMGADSFADFDRWRDWRMIARLVPMAIFNRPGCEEGALNGVAAKSLATHRIDKSNADQLPDMAPPAWVFFPETNNPLSSTTLRAKASSPDTGK